MCRGLNGAAELSGYDCPLAHCRHPTCSPTHNPSPHVVRDCPPEAEGLREETGKQGSHGHHRQAVHSHCMVWLCAWWWQGPMGRGPGSMAAARLGPLRTPEFVPQMWDGPPARLVQKRSGQGDLVRLAGPCLGRANILLDAGSTLGPDWGGSSPTPPCSPHRPCHHRCQLGAPRRARGRSACQGAKGSGRGGGWPPPALEMTKEVSAKTAATLPGLWGGVGWGGCLAPRRRPALGRQRPRAPRGTEGESEAGRAEKRRPRSRSGCRRPVE